MCIHSGRPKSHRHQRQITSHGSRKLHGSWNRPEALESSGKSLERSGKSGCAERVATAAGGITNESRSVLHSCPKLPHLPPRVPSATLLLLTPRTAGSDSHSRNVMSRGSAGCLSNIEASRKQPSATLPDLAPEERSLQARAVEDWMCVCQAGCASVFGEVYRQSNNPEQVLQNWPRSFRFCRRLKYVGG